MAKKRTPEQLQQALADAETAKMRAELDILAGRAEAAAMPAKQVRAIRSALDLFGLLDWSDDGIDAARDRLSDYIDDTRHRTRRLASRDEAMSDDPA